MGKFEEFRSTLQPGRSYRRADLAQWSNAVDRHLKQAVQAGALIKLAGGLYLAPKPTVFGVAPADDGTLIATFLKGGRFLLVPAGAHNALGVGLTQVQNSTVVYNHKRHGIFVLGRRTFDFRVKADFPAKLSREFLMVDLVNNLHRLGEDRGVVLERLTVSITASDMGHLTRAVRLYGSERAKRHFGRAVINDVSSGATDGSRLKGRTGL